MEIIGRIAEFHEELKEWRHDIHAHPELGFEEQRTADFVAQRLAEFGCEVFRGIGKTGVVGRLRAGDSPRSIGLRADMDCLPIEEATNLAYRSQNAGRMHACGHDGHTTMLLGAARHLAETRDFDGAVHLIFQPAEEGLGGGAAMVADGLFDRFPCDAIFGMHNRPGLAVGKFQIRTGAMMAGGAYFDIAVTGRGAHGARPEAGIDPVLTASHIAIALQTIVSRNVRPLDTAVVSVTQIHAGEAYNVIPERAVIGGTARCFSRETMAMIEQNMRRIASGVAGGFGATAALDFRLIFPPLVNDTEEACFIADVAAELVGADNVNRDGNLVMASEDFSYMLEKRPGAYIQIGTATGPMAVGAAAKSTTPATISTTPPCRSAPASSPASPNASSRRDDPSAIFHNVRHTRREASRLRRVAPMKKRIDIAALPPVVGTLYPPPFDAPCRARARAKLGDPAGLTQFGVNLLRLPPGAWSSQRHWHTSGDEFVYVLSGEVVLVTDGGEELLHAGDAAGFPANDPNGHCLQNRSAADAQILEIGSRVADDVAHYSDIDMTAPADGKPALYTHRDGVPYPDLKRRGP